MPRMPRLAASLAASASLALAGCQEEAPKEGGITVPSGREVVYLDTITNAPGTEGATARFRFVVPGLAAGEDASADMQAVCDSFALPRIGGMVPEPQQIIIVFADREVPFGQAAPEAVQFFEAYSIQGERCIWELL